jgi:hypothetical protein
MGPEAGPQGTTSTVKALLDDQKERIGESLSVTHRLKVKGSQARAGSTVFRV